MAVISRDDAADEERWIRYGSAPLIATLVLPIVIGVILLLKCVFNHCCVRKTTTKDEMYGLEGRMTMLPTADSNFVPLASGNLSPTNRPASPVRVTNEATTATLLNAKDTQNTSENSNKSGPSVVNNSEPAENTAPVFEDAIRIAGCSDRAEYRRSSSSRLTSSQDSSELAGSLKRASAQHRQLPDLPLIPGQPSAQNIPRRSSSVLSHDGTSELYATVGETPLHEGSDRPSKRSSHYAQIRENGNGQNSSNAASASAGSVNGVPGPSTSVSGRPSGRGVEATPSSDSETYASSHHPYAKLKKNTEHPYARVRSSGTGGNDEETDTDNYDLPQFLSRQAGLSGNQPSTSSNARPSNVSQANNLGIVGSSADAEGPVPPRRIGRQWRRSSQPQVLNNDNASHFSGDSQDSRGYTSISVREPLSNIRNQVALTRSYDSHYATVSDDSEEMYAAIDDPNDTNYVRIPGEDGHPRRPTWLGGPNVSSPIPERREANSPLPPVPNVPPPDSSPGPSSTVPPSSPNLQTQTLSATTPALPVYAQVTKKSKKGKTPVTPTASNASTSSQQMREAVGSSQSGDLSPLPLVNVPQAGPSNTKEISPFSHHHSHSHHHPPHRSKRAASLMDNTNPMDADALDSRRWSKADISYSEFEVVRESLFPSSDHLSPSASRDILPDSPTSRQQPALPTSTNLVDEDNYNIIPDKARSETRRSANSGNEGSSSSSRRRLDSGNYHVIDPPPNYTYQEIGRGKEPSDHYQEIGERANRDGGCDLYQEIERKTYDDDEDDEEEEDEFYEKVKPSSSKKSKNSDGKKHGYEKIKRKGGSSRPGNLSAVIPAIGSDEEDEDDEKPDQLYESVKYPPYERLNESKDDLVVDSHDEDARNGSDFYEDIGYSRVKPKGKLKAGNIAPPVENKSEGREGQEDDSIRSDQVDVSQLYARVDKSKKRKGATATRNASNQTTAAPAADISGNNNEPPLQTFNTEADFGQLYSKVTKTNKSNKNTEIKSSSSNSVGAGGEHGATENETRLDNDNSIEYI